MERKAGVDETLCYSCQDEDEKGICGENVDDSSPLMTKTVCKEGCMVSKYDVWPWINNYKHKIYGNLELSN